MPFVHLGDATLHYQESGSGHDVVLLLHAFPLHAGMWAPQLAGLTPRFRVIAPDLRGFGRSGPALDGLTLDRAAEDVLALCRQLGVRRAVVAGLSMGGYLALALYRRAPDLFAGLALCDTKAVPDTVEQAAGREQFAQDALQKGLGWVADTFAPKLLRPAADPAVEAQVRRLIQESTAEGVAAAQRMMARRPDAVPALSRVACPTLAVWGEQDQLTPFGEMQRIAQNVKGGRLLRIPAAGHLPNLESPAAFNAALGAFCAAALAPVAPPDPELAPA